MTARGTGITLAAIAVLVVGVVGFGVHVGMGAFAAAVVLILCEGHRREGRRSGDALERDRDGLRRDGADRRCWRRPAESTCSRPSWRGSRPSARSRG